MTWPAPTAASPNPVASFRDLGAAALGRVLTDEELVAVHAAIAEIVPEHGVTGGYACIVHDSWRKSSVLSGLVPKLGALACAALDVPELVLFHDHILVKPPHGDDMPWHQDFSYLPVDNSGGTTLWVALDDVDVANGCIYYLFGTHVHGERRAAWGLLDNDDPRAEFPPMDIDPSEEGLAAPTGAGCVNLHHGLVWHRSPRNQSDRARHTWALSFVVPEARWSPRHAPHPRSAVSPRQEGQPLEDDLLRVRAVTSL